MTPIQKTPKQIVAEHKAAEAWLKFVMPRDFPGYYDDVHNRDIMFEYIYSVLDGWITIGNLSAAAEACRLRLHGLGVASLEAKAVAEKAAAEKKDAERLQTLSEQNVRVATEYLKLRAPTGLLINADFYPATADKIIAFIRRNYPNQAVKDEMLTEAVTTMWDSLDWFDKSPAATQFRNVPPPPPRRLSERQMIESGQKSDPSTRRNHVDDKPLKSVEDVAKEARKLWEKEHGVDPEAEWRAKAEAIYIQNYTGRQNYGQTAELRQVFAKNPDGSTNWRVTFEKRNEVATQAEKELKGRWR